MNHESVHVLHVQQQVTKNSFMSSKVWDLVWISSHTPANRWKYFIGLHCGLVNNKYPYGVCFRVTEMHAIERETHK